MKVQKPRKNEEKRPTQVLHDQDGEQKSCASDAQTDSGSSCSSHGCKKVSHEDIELAQSLIERCLQLYMTQDEVVAILVNRAKLEPGFTKLVWKRLEDENAEFFKAYYARLKLKKQIVLFNLLLERQHHLMKLREPHDVMPSHIHNGLQHMSGGAVNSAMGYLPRQQPCISYNGCTHVESLQYGGSSYMVVDGVPAPGSYYPVQMVAADVGTPGDIKQEMALSCPSTESTHHDVDPMTFDAPFQSNMCGTEGMQLAPDDGVGKFLDNPNPHLTADFSNFKDIGALGHDPSSLFSLSDIDTLLNSPDDQCDIVDHFIVDPDSN